MARYHSYINTALKILQSYNGEMPFSIFIKQFFSKEKKYGSKDRKHIAALCYSYFRVGLALKKQLAEEHILKAFFLTTNQPSPLLEVLSPGWNHKTTLPAREKAVSVEVSIEDIFPFTNELNNSINIDLFCQSFLTQPDLFVRIRPRNKNTTIDKIKASGVSCLFLNDNNTAQFPSATNIENVVEIEKDVVIQDYNSQQVLNYLTTLDKHEISVWDCCAASGGKSILAYDLLKGKINLTVSDIRQSIIGNLKQRFKNAGITNYQSFVADISNDEKKPAPGQYDIIICDAPCSGSGTWGRTPEQLFFFNTSSIEEFAARQKNIVKNTMPHLKAGGLYFYITCSVFKKENEEVAGYISQQKGMQLMEMKNLYGYEMKADSMFVSVFKNTAI